MCPDRLSRIESALEDVTLLLDQLEASTEAWQPWIERVAPEHRDGARNLVHYWSMRQVDVRDLQARLSRLGLSSLESSEAHVRATLQAVALSLSQMLGVQPVPTAGTDTGFDDSARALAANADALLGQRPEDRSARIMVTLPTEAATDPSLVASLIDAGMQIARINCAHDGPQQWRAMAAHVANAAARSGRQCLIAMDLAGPKLRTGPLEPGPRVVRLRPTRNVLGQVLAPARAWLTSAGAPAAAPDGLVSIPVPGGWLRRLSEGDLIELRDTRDSHRWLEVASVGKGGAVVTCDQTVYLGTATPLKIVGGDETGAVGELAAVEQFLRVGADDVLRVTRDLTPAHVVDARIGCTLPEVFDSIEVGQRVHFDDGKIGGTVTDTTADAFDVCLDYPRNPAKLRAGKGINVPDTDLAICALADADREDLATVVDIADIVQFSFVRDPADVEQLFTELDALGAENLGVVLKIENRAAFENLPQLLLTAMRRHQAGVMIARGDLAVECGYERLAEVQEEILWLCGAARIPVVWATQVLEQLAKSGVPSRAEISDAALAERAECVMLNKGPHIDDAVRALCDILTRMAGHQYKTTSLLRPLRSWDQSAPAVGDLG
ncbi:MAG: hypothetical protein KDB70_05660 [Mycobacterium sp.]|nr:hypothetical protein [Mycobacterium sp.]